MNQYLVGLSDKLTEALPHNMQFYSVDAVSEQQARELFLAKVRTDITGEDFGLIILNRDSIKSI
ncbi:hypothetical protein HNR39_000107 [Glaciimonas immobilis]|uniref:Uncharacterized protein n=1 Tax=Glaciimonas immobilis TaxID=728004 RepID=A0A840RJC9_9BURK|nr:hypothetical protein [Glaciimonas immobilis]